MQTSTLEEMTLSQLLMGIILCKPKNISFKEESLEYGLRMASQHYQRLQTLVQKGCTASNPEKGSTLDTLWWFMKIGDMIRSTEDKQQVYMTEDGRRVAEHVLHKKTQKEKEELAALAEIVWEHAESIAPQQSSERVINSLHPRPFYGKNKNTISQEDRKKTLYPI